MLTGECRGYHLLATLGSARAEHGPGVPDVCDENVGPEPLDSAAVVRAIPGALSIEAARSHCMGQIQDQSDRGRRTTCPAVVGRHSVLAAEQAIVCLLEGAPEHGLGVGQESRVAEDPLRQEASGKGRGLVPNRAVPIEDAVQGNAPLVGAAAHRQQQVVLVRRRCVQPPAPHRDEGRAVLADAVHGRGREASDAFRHRFLVPLRGRPDAALHHELPEVLLLPILCNNSIDHHRG
mmetsp:Transcript_51840/g.146880  ORF Transcript_51840/g.146880 Transcript_51840/m.146880 type:complete len:235 (-) Transcript_51840:1721-2425(-)